MNEVHACQKIASCVQVLLCYRVPKMLTGIVARVAYVILEKVHDKCLLYQGTTDHIVTCVHELTCVRIADTHLLCYAIY